MFASLDPNLRTAIAVALGAIPGALCRYYLTVGLAKWLGESFPYGTMFVNLSGSFLMGFIVTLALERALISPDLRLFLALTFPVKSENDDSMRVSSSLPFSISWI